MLKKAVIAFIESLGILALCRNIQKFVKPTKKIKHNCIVKYTHIDEKHEWLKDTGGDKYGWQVHFDYFHRVIYEKMLRSEEQYTDLEIKFYIFNAWLTKVPGCLKMGNDLEKGFKKQVRRYIQDKYDFDPFAYEVNAPANNIPTAEQLAEWWDL